MGALLLIFGLFCILPLPPGSTTLLGAPLVLLAPQLMFGAGAPWLRRAESVSRPRLGFLFGDVGERAIGLVCTLLGLVLILPLPFGNLLPGAAVSVLALSLVQRDGALLLVGYGLTLASAGVLVLAAGMIGRLAHQLIALAPVA
jgi:hypothetical protein